MHLAQQLLLIGEGPRTEDFALFAEALDWDWIEQALAATGHATLRRRKLPAEAVVWLVIGMALLRDRSIQDVLRHLDPVLPAATSGPRGGSVSSSAIVQARDRLGAAPLEALFELLAAHWASASADAHRWRGLAVYGVDGTSLRVPDSAENAHAFGRPRTGRAPAAYPQLRLVVLMVLRSHLLRALALGPWSTGEITLAQSLWAQIPDRSLTLFDRGFLSHRLLHRLHAGGAERHWLIRARSDLKWRVIKRLGPHDALAEITVCRGARRADPELPETLRVRVIRYHRRGFRPQTLLTSLLDPEAFPTAEIVALYHERWELELGFDELKTHTLERQETLRSRAPERVRQEVWGLAVGYNLLRWFMQRVAADAHVTPCRISYRGVLLAVRDLWLSAWLTSPGALPRRLNHLHQDLHFLVLPPRRQRLFPRAVKIKLSAYPRKRPRNGPSR